MLKAKEQETQKIKMARHVAPNREEGDGHLVPGIPRKGEADEDSLGWGRGAACGGGEKSSDPSP